MKNVLDWVKGNWAIVLLSVVALAALPAGVIVAAGMNKNLRESVQKEVQTDYTNVTASKVEYAALLPNGEKVFSQNTDVVKARTEWYQKVGTELQQRTAAAGQAALKFNQRDHAPLVEGLFPAPTALNAELKPREFARAYIEAHKEMLAAAGAGTPPEPAAVGAQLAEAERAEIERIRNEQNRTELSEEERQTLNRTLLEQRIGLYGARAAEIGLYADLSVFDGVPAAVPDQPPTLATCWDWQERLWIHDDVMAAVESANGDTSGGGVPEALVKRLVKVSVQPALYTSTGDRQEVPVNAYDAGVDQAPRDFNYSITGRRSGPGSTNKWYDIREVVVTAVISSERLPAFLDALAATNFMSVLDLDLARVDPLEDLKSGYFYGDDHVVRATLRIEHVMLREWRKDLMPDAVKKALGMVEGVEGEAAPAAPAPTRGRAAPEEDFGGGGRGGRGGRVRGMRGGDDGGGG